MLCQLPVTSSIEASNDEHVIAGRTSYPEHGTAWMTNHAAILPFYRTGTLDFEPQRKLPAEKDDVPLKKAKTSVQFLFLIYSFTVGIITHHINM